MKSSKRIARVLTLLASAVLVSCTTINLGAPSGAQPGGAPATVTVAQATKPTATASATFTQTLTPEPSSTPTITPTASLQPTLGPTATALPTGTAIPTSTALRPPPSYTLQEPKRLRASCSAAPSPDFNDASIWYTTVRWSNSDATQTGVRVFRDGRLVATLIGRDTSFGEHFTHFDGDEGVTYGVQAYGGGRVSSIVTVFLRHCGG